VIVEKYGIHRGGWCLEETQGPYRVCLWRKIRNGLRNLSNYISFKVGDGSHICFWLDVWCGDVALKFSFPELYLIACGKEALVYDYLDSSNTYINWNLSFIRVVHD
jgi:hypothetical protein